MGAKQRLGAHGEGRGEQYLMNRECEILNCDWRIRGYELELVAQDSPGLLTFIEAKTRLSLAFGEQLEAIDAKKASRIQRLALGWMSTNPRGEYNSRFEVAGYIAGNSREYSVEYCEGLL